MVAAKVRRCLWALCFVWRSSPCSALFVGLFGGSLRGSPNVFNVLDPFASRHVPVKIEVTGLNSRRISSSIVIDRCSDDVWGVLTDYDRLASRVPNLVVSRRLLRPDGCRPRVYQEGAQNVAGFDFRASVTMDMEELRLDSQGRPLPQPRVRFSCYDSFMFEQFDGEWRLTPRSVGGKAATRLSYSVDITPKGVVPVPAIEWRVREDVPSNLLALKAAVERRCHSGNKR